MMNRLVCLFRGHVWAFERMVDGIGVLVCVRCGKEQNRGHVPPRLLPKRKDPAV